MAFDNDKYEPVKARKKRFYETFPNGRITVELINEGDPSKHALFKAAVYCNAADQEKRLARAEGYALEIRDVELSKKKDGKVYESVNYSSWVENCEESAVGRALDNAGFASNMHCSAEEIRKAQRREEARAAADEAKAVKKKAPGVPHEGGDSEFPSQVRQSSLNPLDASSNGVATADKAAGFGPDLGKPSSPGPTKSPPVQAVPPPKSSASESSQTQEFPKEKPTSATSTASSSVKLLIPAQYFEEDVPLPEENPPSFGTAAMRNSPLPEGVADPLDQLLKPETRKLVVDFWEKHKVANSLVKERVEKFGGAGAKLDKLTDRQAQMLYADLKATVPTEKWLGKKK